MHSSKKMFSFKEKQGRCNNAFTLVIKRLGLAVADPLSYLAADLVGMRDEEEKFDRSLDDNNAQTWW